MTAEVIAADTNILIRFITNDDERASPRARRFVSETDIYVGVTVLLEASWVLTKTFGMRGELVVKSLRAFLGLPRVTSEAEEAVLRAFDWADQGVAFADALHLSLAIDEKAFATSDRELLRHARARGLAVVEP